MKKTLATIVMTIGLGFGGSQASATESFDSLQYTADGFHQVAVTPIGYKHGRGYYGHRSYGKRFGHHRLYGKFGYRSYGYSPYAKGNYGKGYYGRGYYGKGAYGKPGWKHRY